MLRIRLFRVLLPVLLVGLVVLLIWAISPQPAPQVPRNFDEAPKREASEFTFLGWTLGSDGSLVKSLELVADSTETCGELCYQFSGVKRFELAREQRGSLEVSAASTQLTGPVGQREMRFEGPVRIVDNDLGLTLDLPQLDVDEVAGVGRSSGAIYIEGAHHHTRAERLVYGLAGQATELFRLEVEDDSGGLLLAERAFLHDGVNDMELVQGVRFRRGDTLRFWAETSRIRRDESGRPISFSAEGKVVAGVLAPGGFAEVAGDRLSAQWDDAGNIAQFTVDGRALIEQSPRLVSADRLDFKALPNANGWSVDAHGSVRLSGAVEGGTARVSSDTLSATFDGAYRLREARADGAVRFEAPGIQADAASARVTRSALDDDELAIELNSEQDRRARLAQGLTRVVADTIVTDSRGRSLTATGRVESTMLPEDNAASSQGMFRTDKAVHFISAELHGEDAGGELVLSGNVRGWQGEQNLSAQTVVLERTSGSLRAHGGVGTRFPRAREGAAAASADFVQVTAATLDYDREAYQAVYRGGVRVAVAEGWIECEVLTVTQGRNTGEFERLLAAGQVRIEFLGIDDGSGAPTQRTTGRSDRLVYVPAEKTLWMYGDEQRAVLQRGGEQAGTSEGRVLTYRLDDGTLSVVEGGSVKVPPPPSTAQESETPE